MKWAIVSVILITCGPLFGQTSSPGHWEAKAGAADALKKFVESLPSQKAAYIDSLENQINSLSQQRSNIDHTAVPMKSVGAGEFESDPDAQENHWRQMKDLADKIDACRAQIKAAQDDPLWLPSQNAMMKGEVGSVGGFPIPVTVTQVVDAENLIANAQLLNNSGDRVEVGIWLSGVDTSGLIDDSRLTLKGTYCVSGTKTYSTAIGGSRTVFEVQGTDLTNNLVKVGAFTTLSFEQTAAGKALSDKLSDAKVEERSDEAAAALDFGKTPKAIDLKSNVSEAETRKSSAFGQELLDASHDFLIANNNYKAAEAAVVSLDPQVRAARARLADATEKFRASKAVYDLSPVRVVTEQSDAAAKLVSKWKENDRWEIALYDDGSAHGEPGNNSGSWTKDRDVLSIKWNGGSTDTLFGAENEKTLLGRNAEGTALRYVREK